MFDFALYSSAQKIYTQNNNKIKPNSADTKKIRKVKKKKAYANIAESAHDDSSNLQLHFYGAYL